jgi:predicted AAA+ superfamily ATPase
MVGNSISIGMPIQLSGGFPQIAQTAHPIREALLLDYFDAMILKDIIQRNGG